MRGFLKSLHRQLGSEARRRERGAEEKAVLTGMKKVRSEGGLDAAAEANIEGLAEKLEVRGLMCPWNEDALFFLSSPFLSWI